MTDTPDLARASSPNGASTTLFVDVADRSLTLTLAAETHSIPVGPATLYDELLAETDPPTPAALTNALGLVRDHLDDVLIAAPWFAAARPVVAGGTHSHVLACVELGRDDVPDDYVLTRAAADEVFRTLATEAVDERRHNPGLPATHVVTIVATCCVILGLMRRFELTEVHVAATPDGDLHGDRPRSDGR